MQTIANYQVTEKIYESFSSIVFRATRNIDDVNVILKVLKQDLPTAIELNRYQHEYRIINSLNEDGIIKNFGIEKYKNTCIIVLEDFGGISLKEFLLNKPLPLEKFLTLAIQLSDTLGHIHSCNIIHKDINPANIVINIETNQMKIIDFGIASRLANEKTSLQNPEHLEGTLAYISPEQTGRINRNIDYRADLYSLGCTFYEMLTGHLPFNTDKTMELVHCQIAKKPNALTVLNSDVPNLISEIVLKLISKNAEDRYQTAAGLKADLALCLEHFQLFGSLSNFTLAIGKNDFSGKFSIPQKLYGRSAEIAKLLETFERVSKGSAEMVLIGGYSGVGKTAIVNEVHLPMTKHRGNFISGKFDQFQKNIPYYAITQAFNYFCRYLLTETKNQLSNTRKKIIDAIGEYGQVLLSIVPELELIIGQQPAVAQVGAIEEQNRFNKVFLRFFDALCDKEHPLIFFIDDLQWADSASLELLHALMTREGRKHFLIIGAFRDNEVDDNHPFIKMVNTLTSVKTKVSQITLDNLTHDDVSHMIKESLGCHSKDCQQLTDLVYDKTFGNAFFTQQFLHTLNDKNLLTFDFTKNKWRWEIEKIATVNITDNVVDLMAEKISNLQTEKSELLQLAACIGNQFDLQTLITISEYESAKYVLDLLWDAIQDGLIIPINKNYKLIGVANIKPEKVLFKFLHDRIQQAAYSLIIDKNKAKTHLHAGRLLFEKHHLSDSFNEKLFDIVNQFNKGIDLVDEPSEKLTIAKLNLQAGQKSANSTAYIAAESYFSAARKVLPEDAMSTHYDIAFAIHLDSAKNYYILNKFEKSKKLYPILLKAAKSKMDKVNVYAIKMDDLHLQGEFEKALQVQSQALTLLEIEVPKANKEELITEELANISLNLAGRDISQLTDAKEMESIEQKSALKILIGMWVTSYLLSNKTIVEWASVKMCNLCLQHGNSELASFAYLQYGYVCVNRLESFDMGYDFGKVAITLSNNYPNLDIRGKVYFMFGLTISHWKKHVNLSTEVFKKSYKYSVEAGDWTYAGYSAINIISNLLIDGHSCQETYKEAKFYLEFLNDKTSEALNSFFIPGVFCALLNLTEKTKGVGTFDCDYFNESEFIAHYSEQHIVMALFYIGKIRSLYLFGKYQDGLELFEKTDIVSIGMPAQVGITEVYFYSCLTLIAADEFLENTPQRKRYWKSFTHYQQQMKIWALHCPENYEHKYLLIEAEKARLDNKDFGTTFGLYQQALSSATKYNYPNIVALSHELIAKFWLQLKHEQYADVHINKSIYAYEQWGATAKVNYMNDKYPHLFTKTHVPVKSASLPEITSSSLDLESVIKASNILSSEIILERLLEKMLTIILENSGATSVTLILKNNDDWFIEGQAQINNTDVSILQAIPLDEFDELPLGLIRYIIRTQKTTVYSNISAESDFLQDQYVQKNQPKSILVNPLLNQGDLIGILYVENDLTESAFDDERLKLITLLSSQIAISLENSMSYKKIEEKVENRTIELQNILINLKQTQEQLIESEKMASLGGLVAGIAHELNTPIGIGVMASSILNDKMQSFNLKVKDNKLTKTILNNFITEAGQSTDLIVSNLKKASDQIDNFKMVAVDVSSEFRRTINLSKYLKQIQTSLTPKTRNQCQSFTVTCEDNIETQCDPSALTQIVTNLVENSITHAFNQEHQGCITISVKEKDDLITLKFHDDGKGMDSDTQDKVFEPFFTTKRGYGGSGLGMHIVYNIVTQKLKGKITCKSKLGEGTLFTISFTKSCL